jgi:hypothetical protein
VILEDELKGSNSPAEPPRYFSLFSRGRFTGLMTRAGLAGWLRVTAARHHSITARRAARPSHGKEGE